jgi:hypothetical protein
MQVISCEHAVKYGPECDIHHTSTSPLLAFRRRYRLRCPPVQRRLLALAD